MILAAQGVAGTIFVFFVVAAVIGIPISIALVNNRRHAQATRYAHMDGWAHGSPLSSVSPYQDGPPSSTPGPRIVAYGTGPRGTAIRIVNGPPLARPGPPGSFAARNPIVVVPRPSDDAVGDLLHADASTGGAAVQGAQAGPEVAVVVSAFDETPSFVPPAPPPLAAGTAEVQMLGYPRVLGWISEPPRRSPVELGCYLGLHGERPVTQDQVRMALGTGKADASAQTVRNAMSMLRQCLGRELVPEVGKIGYRLSAEVTTDWACFQELVASAVTGAPDEVDRLIDALSKVRGAPFEGVVANTYAWAWSELWVARMETAIVDAAHRAAALSLASGEVDKARWAALQGLLAVPNDMQLWTANLEAAAARGRAELERAYDHARSVLGEDVSELAKIVQQLQDKIT